MKDPLDYTMTNPGRRARFIDAFEIALVADDGAIAFASSFDFHGKTACYISRYRLKRNNLFVGNDLTLSDNIYNNMYIELIISNDLNYIIK